MAVGVLTQKGMIDCAINDFTKAIELKSNYARAYCGRGIAYGSQGNNTCAIRDYDKAIELDPNYVVAYNSRGLAKYRLGRTEEAKQDLQTALRLAEQAGNELLKADIELGIRELD